MTTAHQPVKFSIAPDGTISGAHPEYTKDLGAMAEVYRDADAYAAAVAEHGPDRQVYRVQNQLYGVREGELTIGTSCLLPGKYGREYAATRGHLHTIAGRAELYYCLSGRGVMLLETLDGRCEAIELHPGDAVNVPGHWVHRSVNVGDVPFVTLFTYASDAGQDYGVIAEAGGMKTLVVDDGNGAWTTEPNPDHRGYRSGDDV